MDFVFRVGVALAGGDSAHKRAVVSVYEILPKMDKAPERRPSRLHYCRPLTGVAIYSNPQRSVADFPSCRLLPPLRVLPLFSEAESLFNRRQ